MALNRQSQKDIQDTATYIEDTLKSVSANLGEVFKNAVESAFDGVDATVMTVATKDFARAMAAAAKTSEDLVKNHYRISQGLTTSKNLEKQLQTIAERKLELERKYAYTKQLAEDIGKKMTKQQQQAFKDAQAALDLQEQILEADRQDLVIIEKKLGLTGKLIQSLGKVPGIGKFIKADEIDQEMRKAAAKGAGRLQTMGVAGKMIGKQLFDGLLDPLALITAIWNGFMKVDEAATDFTRITGQSTSAISSMNSNLASTVDILQVASDLSKELGIAGNNFISPQQLAAVAETKNLLGLSAEQATKLAIQTKMSGQNVDTFKKNVMAGVKQSNLQNRSGVEYGVVIKDILDTSEDVTMSLGNNPKKLAAAATAARAFGLTLQQVDDIANSLMNFEDSIGAELEAQLLTGKNINLSKARELALNNDLEGVANELAKNGASAAEFSQMNRIQQEGLAKALGMSREQLAKSVLAQEASKDLTDKQRAAVMGMSEAEYERVSIQERIQTSLDKIAQAFAPILEKFVVPIVEGLTKLMNLPLVPYILAGVVAINSLGGGVLKVVSGMGSLAKGALDFVKNLNMKGISEFFGGLKGKLGDLKKAFGEGFADKVQEKVADAGGGITEKLSDKAQEKVEERVESLVDKATEAGKEVPEKTGGGMSSLTESIQKIKPTQILAGAAALVLVAGAVFIFAKAAQEFATVSWEDMAKAGVGLLGLVAALAAVGAIMMSGVGALAILAGAAAIVVMAGGLFILGKALQEVGEGMQMMEPALSLVASIGDKAIGLMTVGASLMGIAAGLREIASAGTGAIPVLDKINTLAGGGNKSAGEAKGKGEGGVDALIQKVDILVTELTKGRPVQIMLDGKVAATAIVGGGGGAAKTQSNQR